MDERLHYIGLQKQDTKNTTVLMSLYMINDVNEVEVKILPLVAFQMDYL